MKHLSFSGSLLFFVGLISACETPAPKTSEPTSESLSAETQTGYLSIAGPAGIAQGEYTYSVDFQTKRGKWSLNVVSDTEGFLEPEKDLALYGDRLSSGDYLFTDVENFTRDRDRDPAVALTLHDGKVVKIVYGNWPAYLTKNRDGLKKIQRYAGSYSFKDGTDLVKVEYSLVLNWELSPVEGTYWQSHVEKEGKVPEDVVVADEWSFASTELKVSDGSCKGCKVVAIRQQVEDEAGNKTLDDSRPAVTIQLSGEQKVNSIQAGKYGTTIGK